MYLKNFILFYIILRRIYIANKIFIFLKERKEAINVWKIN